MLLPPGGPARRLERLELPYEYAAPDGGPLLNRQVPSRGRESLV